MIEFSFYVPGDCTTIELPLRRTLVLRDFYSKIIV